MLMKRANSQLNPTTSAFKRTMIILSSTKSSSVESVAILTLLTIFSFTSLLLNPVVFLYSLRSNSVASFMFCALALLDLLSSSFWPAVVLYYAATLDRQSENMTCIEQMTFPLNCYVMPANNVQRAFSTVIWVIFTTTVTTSGVMVVVRYIQIRYPFTIITRRKVAQILVIFCIVNILEYSLLFFIAEPPFTTILYLVVVENPFQFSFEPRIFNHVFTVSILNSISVITEVIAITLSIQTVIEISKTNQAVSNTRKAKRLGCIKILLMNLSNLLFLAVSLGVPIILSYGDIGIENQLLPSVSEQQGWILFALDTLTPLFSSAWNPIVFISLSPKCKVFIREVVVKHKRQAVIQNTPNVLSPKSNFLNRS